MNEILIHYGIPGMKWGIRRYQNKDGSLTNAGKKRYQKSEEQVKSEKQKRSDSKNRGTLSDEELQSKIKRLKMEKELKDLTAEEVSPGKKFVQSIMSDAGKKIATTALTGGGLYMLYKMASGESLDRKDFGLSLAKGQFTQSEKKKDSSNDYMSKLTEQVKKLNLEKQLKDLTTPKTLSENDALREQIANIQLKDQLEELMKNRDK